MLLKTMALEDKGRMQEDKIVETMKFLLTSVKKLSDTFVESEGQMRRGFGGVEKDLAEVRQQLQWLQRVVEERSAAAEAAAGGGNETGSSGGGSWNTASHAQLPVVPGTEEFRVPVLNLPVETIVDVYANTPILLEPFSRPCSLTGRTLSGEIDEVELEVFSQGSTWVVESHPGGWLLIPRPGSLERKTSLQSLERLYTIEGVKQLPVLLHLMRPAQLDAVVVGQRWQLQAKGLLSVSPDPLRVGLSERMASLEQRLVVLEGKQAG
jgi:hypothetical protein